jgi:hypothetical protein
MLLLKILTYGKLPFRDVSIPEQVVERIQRMRSLIVFLLVSIGNKNSPWFWLGLYLTQVLTIRPCWLTLVILRIWEISLGFLSELSWLNEERFYDLVVDEWATVPPENTPIETWQRKIRHLRRFLRGWAKNLSGKYRKEKERLLNIIDTLDIKAESVPLSSAERYELKLANEKINKLRRDEETK